MHFLSDKKVGEASNSDVPRRRGGAYQEKEKDKPTYSDKLQDKTIHRLQTVLVFGLPPQMKPENIRKKYKVFSFFTYRFPCPAPFNGRDMVAEITVKDSKQIKDVFTPLFP